VTDQASALGEQAYQRSLYALLSVSVRDPIWPGRPAPGRAVVARFVLVGGVAGHI
jgi:hypothetical protein